MAKIDKDKGLSLDDFNNENLFDDNVDNDIDEQEDEVEVDEDEEDEEEETPKKPASKKKKKKTTIIEEEEEEAEAESKPKKKKKAEKKPKTVEEDEADEEDEVEADEVESDEDETDDQEDDESDEDQTPQSEKFFEEVQKITGLEVDVDYGEVDPLTPQGVALREKALGERVLDNFIDTIKNEHPKLFMAFQHAYAGGDIESLFQKVSQRDYSKLEIKEGDDDVARQVLREYYQGKGVKNETKLKKLIESEEESEEGLVKAAQMVVKEMAEEQQNAQKTTLENQQREKEAQNRKDKAFLSSMAEIIDTGKLETFKLAGRTEIDQFKQFLVKDITRRDDGGYALKVNIEPKDMMKLLQYEYFRFKGGDLDKLIKVKASTENAKNLKLRIQGDKQKVKGTGAEASAIQKLSLRDFNN